jgi:hypothetical protein
MDFTKDIDLMSQYCGNILLRIKTDFTQLGLNWNPELIDQGYGLYCVCSGVMWAPATGFVIEQEITNKKVLEYFEKYYPNATYT